MNYELESTLLEALDTQDIKRVLRCIKAGQNIDSLSIKFFLKPTMGLITALMIPNFLFTI